MTDLLNFNLLLDKCKSCSNYEQLTGCLGTFFRNNDLEGQCSSDLERQAWAYIEMNGINDEVISYVMWDIYRQESRINCVPVFESQADLIAGILQYLHFKKIL